MSSFGEHRMSGMSATEGPVTPKEKDNIMWNLYRDRRYESTSFGWLRNIEERCEVICQELVKAGYVKYINVESLGSSHTTVYITKEGERFCETTSFSDSDQPLVTKSNLMFNPFGSQFEEFKVHVHYPVAIVKKKSNHKFSLVVRTDLLPILLENVEYDKIEFTDHYPSLFVVNGDDTKMIDYHDIIRENDRKQTL